jgi:hypothetical protein
VVREELERLAADCGGFVRTATVDGVRAGAVALFVRFEGGVPTLGCTGPTEEIAEARLLHSLARQGDLVLDVSLCALSKGERPQDLLLHLAPALKARGFEVDEPEHAWQVLEALRAALGEKHFRGGLIVLGLTPDDLDRTLAVLDSRAH